MSDKERLKAELEKRGWKLRTWCRPCGCEYYEVESDWGTLSPEYDDLEGIEYWMKNVTKGEPYKEAEAMAPEECYGDWRAMSLACSCCMFRDACREETKDAD